MTLPLVFPDDSPRARRADPISSHEAADATAGSVWASQQAALDIMRAHGKPMTALQIEQIAAARELPYTPQRLRTALPELEEKGLVERTGFTKRPGDRTKRQLWRLTGGSDAS